MRKYFLLLSFAVIAHSVFAQTKSGKPNVIIILADDLGYGDLSCYGATKLHTPNVDELAKNGIRFTDGHCTSSTCTPSRYSLLTGKYAWRKKGTGVLPGDAALIIPTDKITLPGIFKKAGYTTAVVGKWHLGLGDAVQKDWNNKISPGPNNVGFDYSFIFPATSDRVPTVFLENQEVVALDKNDPIAVDYKNKIGNEPTGLENPELLKMKASPNHGHNNTIVNGIGRIGFMTGGKTARWVDEEITSTFLSKAEAFIDANKQAPFFLYFALPEPHVPRMPATMFKGKSGLGFRGDAILQLDYTVGQLRQHLKSLGLLDNTLIIFSSDNGPVLDDGYADGAVTQLNDHTPAGPLRGGKYSLLEAGTRVPFIVSWPAKLKASTSNAVVSQIDFLQSFAKMLNISVSNVEAADSENILDALLGKSKKGREILIEHSWSLTIVKDNWKYLEPNDGPANTGPTLTNIETGNSTEPQLYDLSKDIGEKNNLAKQYPEKIAALKKLLEEIKNRD